MSFTQGPCLIRADALSFERNGRRILDKVSIAIAEGEVVSLIGPNGAGKSTLLKILLGLLKPDSGRVEQRAALRLGYMPQRLVIEPSMPLTVERFMALAGRERDKAERCLALCGIVRLKKQSVQTLSGGELQRLLLARALYREPQLLVLDEPAQGVDIAGQSALYHLINQIRAESGCGVIMVSHDLHVVMANTDRVLCLNQHICCEGHPHNVRSDPEFLQLFGESKALNLATYTHHHDHTHDPLETRHVHELVHTHEHCDAEHDNGTLNNKVEK